MNSMYEWCEKIERNQKFPNSFRCLIIGESNSGKTCLLFKFLLEDSWLDYNNLILIGNSLDQLKYKIITEAFLCGYTKEEVRTLFCLKDQIMKLKVGTLYCKEDEYEGLIKFIRDWKSKKCMNRGKRPTITVSKFDSNEDIPDPKTISKSFKTIVIFDDTMNNRNQETQKSYFTRGRHSNCSVFYLAQSYYELDRNSIRLNSNVLILFNLGELDVQNIWRDKIQKDLSLNEFQTYCRDAWNDNYGFVLINFNEKFESGKRYGTHKDVF